MTSQEYLVCSDLGAIALTGSEQRIQEYIQRQHTVNEYAGRNTRRNLEEYRFETGINPVEEIPGYLPDFLQVRHLDAGCGQAVASAQLAGNFKDNPRVRVCALDILPLEKIPKGVNFLQADLTRFCNPGFYNMIGLPFVIPYVPNPLKAIANMYNSLVPGQDKAPGILGFSLHIDNIRIDGLPIDHKNSLFRKRVKDAGGEVLVSERPNPHREKMCEGMAVMQLIKWGKGRLCFDDLMETWVRSFLGFPIDASYLTG